MNSAQHYSELLKCSERLHSALTAEREANVFIPEDLSYLKWQDRLRMARRDVEHAAEYYAEALRTFRLAMLSELAPSERSHTCRPARIANRREKMRTMTAACRNGRSHARFAKLQ
jgi:hypothetical protein